jgi:hypothetical protein
MFDRKQDSNPHNQTRILLENSECCEILIETRPGKRAPRQMCGFTTQTETNRESTDRLFRARTNHTMTFIGPEISDPHAKVRASVCVPQGGTQRLIGIGKIE